MKFTLITLFTLLLSTAGFSQKKIVEDSIPVSGNCEMCKARIEAALDKPGIKRLIQCMQSCRTVAYIGM